MFSEYLVVINPLLLSLLLGCLIGFERALHGRPAGLRTHSLVCVSSCLLMLITVYQWDLLSASIPAEAIRIDPTRMAQGIMTGIGFLGAGVIMKEKLTIRGLTTAASIWMTASIGIMVGLGFNIAAISATVITLVVLVTFGRFENRLPARRFGHLVLRFDNADNIEHQDIYEILRNSKVKGFQPSYHMINNGKSFEYNMTVYTKNLKNFKHLAENLKSVEHLQEFSISPTGD